MKRRGLPSLGRRANDRLQSSGRLCVVHCISTIFLQLHIRLVGACLGLEKVSYTVQYSTVQYSTVQYSTVQYTYSDCDDGGSRIKTSMTLTLQSDGRNLR
jgi:hypothetical protein